VPGISARLTAIAAAMLPNALLLPLLGRLQRRNRDLCPCGSGKTFKECCRSSHAQQTRSS
jgi:uncharacterized protein